MLTFPEVRLLVTLFLVLTVPGWFLLSLTGEWKRWSPLNRWIIAFGISTAFFPILFYFLRLIVPFLRIGVNKEILLLLVMGAGALLLLRGNWMQQIHFDRIEWLAMFVFAVTLYTRLWFAHNNPIPAWSDSLHHTLITQLTAVNGMLPLTLEPYEPASLEMYHLGLHAISGVAQGLSGVPAHMALLWTAQMLNGLCGLGVYLILSSRVGKVGAVVAAAVVGLFSFQPFWYVNWGRFTQVASQFLLVIAWAVTWKTIHQWWAREMENRGTKTDIGLLVIAAMLNAGVFLLHYRVAFYYLPLLLITIIFEGIICCRANQAIPGRFFQGLVFTGVASIFFVLPALVPALQTYVYWKLGLAQGSNGLMVEADSYFQVALEAVFLIGAKQWLLAVSAASLLIGLWRRSTLSWITFAWLVLLVIEGNLYRLGIPLLNISNFSAIMLMFYLPFSLLIGVAVEDLRKIPLFSARYVVPLAVIALVAASLLAVPARLANREDFRYFVTPADLVAMDWIAQNTPEKSLFGVNTFFWFPDYPHGSDAGFWIPYFTGRATNTGTMLFRLGSEQYVNEVILRSAAIQDMKDNYQSVEKLCDAGISYLYAGAKGDFTGNGFNVERMRSVPGLTPVFEQGGVSIFQVSCPLMQQ